VAQHTQTARQKEAGTLGLLVAMVRRLGEGGEAATTEAVVSALTEALGSSESAARAWLAASDVMAEYLTAPVEEASDALDEETSAVAASRRAFRPLLQARLQVRLDRIDEATVGQATCSECGGAMSSHGRRTRGWESTLGTLELTRRWSLCTESKQHPGRSLAQERLLLPEGTHTAHLEESITLMATTVPHGMATALIGRLLGVSISEHAVQDAAERRGAGVEALQAAGAQELRPFDDLGLERPWARPDDAVEQAPEVAYVEVDGVLPMTRELDEGQSQPVRGARGGKGLRYTLVGREVKNAVLYTDQDCARESDSRGCLLDKGYVSHLGHWKDFALQLWSSMVQRRFDEAQRVVLLSDGADWIRSLAEWLPTPVFLILDLYHAMHRIWEVGRAVYGEKTPECSAWAAEQCRRVEAGQVDGVIESLCFLAGDSPRGREKIEELVTYFKNNRDRMDYPSYKAQGLRITSGIVESANYHVTGARLKLQGMRWSEEGAAQMAKLRADLFNDVWSERTRQLLAA